ncbi:hypothetical protein JHK87_043733 [Glycine soja]|nr:hypothetical protein JHK87_043733 [Glycine soja]
MIGNEHATVNALIHSNYSSWKYDLIVQIFNQRDVQEILPIPLLNKDDTDQIIWKQSPNGSYTVRLAYHPTHGFNCRYLEFEGFKCNVEATLFKEDLSFGVGMIIRDHQGNFVKAQTLAQMVCLSLKKLNHAAFSKLQSGFPLLICTRSPLSLTANQSWIRSTQQLKEFQKQMSSYLHVLNFFLILQIG